MRFLFTTLALLLGTFISSFAQTPTWQWGRRGGSNASNENESIKDIATDPNGNVYILSQVRYTSGGSATTDIAGNTIVGWGAQDVVLSSFTCNGVYRWSKVFGSSSVDIPFSLETDSLGGVYATMRIFHGTAIGAQGEFHVSSDSTIPSGLNKALLLVKYDTAGNYQWIRMPQDVGYTGNQTDPLDMQVDGGGNIFWLNKLYTGAYLNGLYNISSPKIGILKYDRNGVALGGITMDISTAANTGVYYYSKLFLTRNHKTGRLYLSGYFSVSGFPAMSFGNTSISKRMFVGAFSSAGTSLWTVQNTFGPSIPANDGMDRVSLDDSGNIYVPANCSHGDAFAGSAPILNTIAGIQEMAFLAKLDSNGNLKWLKNSLIGNSEALDSKGALTSDGKFVLACGLVGTISWAGLSGSLTSTPGGNGEHDFYITRFDAATGQPLSMDTLTSVTASATNTPDFAHADRKGNVYFGGQMDRGVVVAGNTLTAAGNQRSDFFLAKYGYANCNCITPVASLVQSNYNNATRSVTFQYTGTTAGVDSIVWTWGNNLAPIRLTGGVMTAPIPRSYGTDTGTYNVCVTAYTAGCGNNTACTTLRFGPLGIGQLTAGGADMQLAPNPAAGATTVTYVLQGNSGSLEVYDLAGRLLYRRVVSGKTGTETLSLTDYVAGVYMVVLREEGGATQYRRLVVE